MKRRLLHAIIGLLLILTPLGAVAQDADEGMAERLTTDFEVARPGNARAEAANRLAAFLTQEEALMNTYHFTRHSPDDSLRMILYDGLTQYYYDHSLFRQCIRMADRAIPPTRAMKDTASWYSLLTRQTEAYVRTGDFDRARQSIRTCLDVAKRQGDPRRLAMAYNNMGGLYHHMRDDSFAIVMFHQGLETLQPIKEAKPDRASLLYNLGGTYTDMGRTEEAMKVLNEALAIAQELGDTVRISRVHSTMGLVCMNTGQLDRAEQYFQQALDGAQRMGNPVGIIYCLIDLGEVKQKQGRTAESATYRKQADELAHEMGFAELEMKACDGLYALYRHSDPALALAYLERNKALGDSLYRLDAEEQFKAFRVEYETSEKEHRIAMQNEELQRRNLQRWLLAVGIVACLVVLVVVNRYRRLVRRRNRELRAMNATKDKLFSVISHDLKSPAIAQKMAMQEILSNFENYDSETLGHYLSLFYRASEAQVDLLHNLLNWAHTQTDRIGYEPSDFDLRDLMREAMGLYLMSAENKEITLRTDFTDAPCPVRADRQMLHTVVRNLVNNALKFSDPGSEICLTITRSGSTLSAFVHDSGKGMTEEQIHTVLHTDTLRSTPGTRGEKGSGLGLNICRELLLRNGCQLILRSHPGQGTEAGFEIKCVNE